MLDILSALLDLSDDTKTRAYLAVLRDTDSDTEYVADESGTYYRILNTKEY